MFDRYCQTKTPCNGYAKENIFFYLMIEGAGVRGLDGLTDENRHQIPY